MMMVIKRISLRPQEVRKKSSETMLALREFLRFDEFLHLVVRAAIIRLIGSIIGSSIQLLTD